MSRERNLQACRRCGRKMRPLHTTLDRYPNTVMTGSAYLCKAHMAKRSQNVEGQSLYSMIAPQPADVATVTSMVERRLEGQARVEVLGMLGIA